MINNVTLTGRLTKDVDLRYTGTGTAVASFSMAVDRQFKNANGEKETDFINVVAWRKTAETLAEHTRKGSLIGIVGRIQTRNYEGNDGKRVYVTEVVADSFTFLESKKQQESNGSGNNQGSYQGNSNNRTQAQNDPFLSSGKEINVDEFEMPF
ncbi:single-stranded DNA-binding protein [Jeotgalibaca porci]|uniref:Single-stranded DNA-binding protein n=1 Tax=Jeotgalibaca porci TaxID=1868793 RepID=A0A6G7WEB7_9LACT|nr:single-stranded DNA-binding protein [Jeotgalibaca porci]QIK50593.1 single-stranded DNA-binding protein [Jeotgalibaca porci]